mmetsp:Transcript_4847/g.6412  ORF Transcript_4847/g.6412 Transcript_4847/m.6412 type:complete len:109 (-) Transcript_4847:333-659(-)
MYENKADAAFPVTTVDEVVAAGVAKETVAAVETVKAAKTVTAAAAEPALEKKVEVEYTHHFESAKSSHVEEKKGEEPPMMGKSTRFTPLKNSKALVPVENPAEDCELC